MKADLIIVGAGAAGLAIAREAVSNNLKTLLVDEGNPLSSASGHSQGVLYRGYKFLSDEFPPPRFVDHLAKGQQQWEALDDGKSRPYYYATRIGGARFRNVVENSNRGDVVFNPVQLTDSAACSLPFYSKGLFARGAIFETEERVASWDSIVEELTKYPPQTDCPRFFNATYLSHTEHSSGVSVVTKQNDITEEHEAQALILATGSTADCDKFKSIETILTIRCPDDNPSDLPVINGYFHNLFEEPSDHELRLARYNLHVVTQDFNGGKDRIMLVGSNYLSRSPDAEWGKAELGPRFRVVKKHLQRLMPKHNLSNMKWSHYNGSLAKPRLRASLCDPPRFVDEGEHQRVAQVTSDRLTIVKSIARCAEKFLQRFQPIVSEPWPNSALPLEGGWKHLAEVVHYADFSAILL